MQKVNDEIKTLQSMVAETIKKPGVKTQIRPTQNPSNSMNSSSEDGDKKSKTPGRDNKINSKINAGTSKNDSNRASSPGSEISKTEDLSSNGTKGDKGSFGLKRPSTAMTARTDTTAATSMNGASVKTPAPKTTLKPPSNIAAK
jgi:hypothetical protein